MPIMAIELEKQELHVPPPSGLIQSCTFKGRTCMYAILLVSTLLFEEWI
jgi:hypothetical protein